MSFVYIQGREPIPAVRSEIMGLILRSEIAERWVGYGWPLPVRAAAEDALEALHGGDDETIDAIHRRELRPSPELALRLASDAADRLAVPIFVAESANWIPRRPRILEQLQAAWDHAQQPGEIRTPGLNPIYRNQWTAGGGVSRAHLGDMGRDLSVRITQHEWPWRDTWCHVRAYYRLEE